MSDGTIYAGSMRYRAAAALPESWRREQFGSDGIPAVLEDLSLEIAKERAIRDNGSWGEWAEQDLAEMLVELEARGVPINTLGFGPDELERLLGIVLGQKLGDDDAFDPTPPLHPKSVAGDLYLLGPHRLVCGDSRDPRVWNALMEIAPDAPLADAMWTDPPYGVDLHVDGVRAIQGDRRPEIGPLLAAALPNADRWLRAGAPIYMAGPSGQMGAEFVRAWQDASWHLAQSLVWVKNGFVPGRSDYHHQHEVIYYGWKPGDAHTWIGNLDKSTVLDDETDVSHLRREELMALIKQLRNNRGTDVIREERTRHNDLHPTMKPTALIRVMLANSTRSGDLILDPFAGSGSTIVAGHLMRRHVAAIELEPSFCDVIVRRWRELDPTNETQFRRNGQTITISG
jgi:DNA modification methylase